MKIEVDDSNRMRFPDWELERGKKLLEKLPMRLSKIEDTQVLTKYRANMIFGQSHIQNVACDLVQHFFGALKMQFNFSYSN